MTKISKYRSEIVATILAIIVIAASYDVYHRTQTQPRLRIISYLQQRLDDRYGLDDLLPKGQTIIRLADESITNPLISLIFIDNPGNAPIRPEDFVQPLTVRPSPEGRIVFSTELYPTNRDIKVSWAQVTNNVLRLTPTVINPGDTFAISLMTVRSNYADASFEWHARIVGVENIEQINFGNYLTPTGIRSLYCVFMDQKMIAVFFMIFLACMVLTITAWRSLFARRSRRIAATLCLAAMSVLSIIAAEFITYSITNGIRNQFIGSYIGSGLYVAGVIFGFIKTRSPNKEPKATR